MKRHYENLDGLRGTAALMVVLFHLGEGIFPSLATNPLHHAYLAVDFFYLLSGFVIGYAYDDRWPTMNIKEFLKIRVIRLHPMVILSILIGALSYTFDPFALKEQQVTFFRLLGGMALGMMLLPSPALPNRWGETHSLNGPSWSLFQEYLANIAYALIGPRLNKTALWIIVGLSGTALIVTGIYKSDLSLGWGWDNIWAAPIRTVFPFFAGLLLYRSGKRIRMKFAYPVLSLLLIIIFILPSFKYNGLFDALCIICVFPLVVAAGAGGHVSGRWAKLSRFSGQISYPLYIIHYPFIYIFFHWRFSTNPSTSMIALVATSLFFFFILLAWLSLRFYDEPVRKWLKKITTIKQKEQPLLVN